MYKKQIQHLSHETRVNLLTPKLVHLVQNLLIKKNVATVASQKLTLTTFL